MPNKDIAKSTGPPQDCLTPGDRALLNAVFGWRMPGAACMPPSVHTGGTPVLIPLISWVIADARRHGDVAGKITSGQFAAAAASVNRSPTPALRLTAAQIARGLRHLQAADTTPSAEMLGRLLTAGRATAAAG